MKMAETNKKNWVDNFASAIGESGGSTAPKEEGASTDKYANLETTSYKEMLNSKIQASAAKDQAMKYVNNSLKGAGYGTQGMAESTRAGIYGNYQKAITEADQTHANNLLDIANSRANEEEAKGTDRWQSAMEMLQQATSQEDLDYVKNNFYDSFSDDQKKYFDYYYASFGSQMPGNTVDLGSEYTYDKGTDVYAYDRKTGGSVSVSGKFNVENETLNSAIAKGELKRDSYIQLANTAGQDIYIYFDKSGKLYYISKATYDSQNENKFHIYGKDNKIYTGAYGG